MSVGGRPPVARRIGLIHLYVPCRTARFRLLALASLAAVLGGCAGNPWREAYAPVGPQPVVPAARPELVLVEFEEAVPQREPDGYRTVGHASFTGTHSRRVEGQLRDFASQLGADRVDWGARFLHTTRRTTLQPTFDTFHSRTRGDFYDPRTGRYEDVNLHTSATRTRHVPVVDVDATYAYRAVFFRRDDGEGRD